ncbi:MAG: AAA family ATPase [Phycisphaerae bacterium]|nr:AAA family ATPase [Phycisphaerae bacterium]
MPALKVGIYDEDTAGGALLRDAAKQIDEVTVVGACSRWQELQLLVSEQPVDTLLASLDDVNGRLSLAVVRRIIETVPDCGIIGVSRHGEPEAIISAMRAGCHQFVRVPIDQQDLRAAFACMERTSRSDSNECLRIAIIGASGGAGATTVACNLAIEMAQVTGSRCALVDMDLHFGDVANALDLRPQYTISDVCEAGREVDEAVVNSAMSDLPTQVSVLTAPHEIEQADNLSSEAISQMLRVLGEIFPFVVMDVPRYFSPQVTAALVLADRALVVTQLTVPQIMHAGRIHRSLVHRGANGDQIDFVLSRSNSNFGRLTRDEAEAHLGRPVYAAIPNDYKQIGASRDHGTPLLAISPHNPVRLAIHDLACRLVSDHLGEGWQQNKAGGGFLGRFGFRRGARTRKHSAS